METMPERLRAVLASQPGVRLGYVFGSAARGALRADSDVDVAVRFAARPTLDGLAALALNLERAAGRRADVIDLDTAHLRHVQAETCTPGPRRIVPVRAEVVRRKTRARSGAPAARCIGAHHAAKEIAAIPKAWSRH